MVVYIVCSLVALLASGLTFFSGFGLGTLLTPVFALFFPIEIAITITSIVHFLNNLFKCFDRTYGILFNDSRAIIVSILLSTLL